MIKPIDKRLPDIISEPSLFRAWESVAAKRSAPGMDNVSVERFADNAPQRLRQLRRQVLDGDYSPLPLVVFQKEKSGGGFRELTVPAIRDKIVARALSEYLSADFNAAMVPQCYSFRPRRGALKAVAAVRRALAAGGLNYVVRLDIEKFFDRIDHDILIDNLSRRGVSGDTIALLMKFADNPRFNGVKLTAPGIGVPQGVPVSPILSNLYLDDFDHQLVGDGVAFARYADDIAAFADTADTAGELLNTMNRWLEQIKLRGSIDKTRIYAASQGFTFLGFIFSPDGAVPGKEAEERLRGKLVEGACDDETASEFDRRRQAIVRGWNNYYHSPEATGESDPATDESAASLAGRRLPTSEPPAVSDAPPASEASSSRQDAPSQSRGDENDGARPEQTQSDEISDDHPQMDERLANIDDLIATGRTMAAMSKLRALLDDGDNPPPKGRIKELTTKLADLYERLGMRGAANLCRQSVGLAAKNNGDNADPPAFGAADVAKWLEIFGSESMVYRQYIDRLGRHGYKPFHQKLTAKDLERHWSGAHTLAVPVFKPGGNLRFGLLDFDISKQTWDSLDKNAVAELKERLLDDVRGIQQLAFKQGVESVIEDSGHKGWHLWFFLFDNLDGKLVKNFLLELERIAGPPPEGTHRERFPASDKMRPDQLNSRIKLPLGLHKVSGRKSKFMTPDGIENLKGVTLLSERAVFNRAAKLKKAVEEWTRFRRQVQENKDENETGNPNSGNAVSILYGKCAVLDGLRRKAESTRELNHYERSVIRGVLAPLGEDGADEIHRILKNCQNYSRGVTDKMIGQNTGHPIGCARIKEILGRFCAEVGCQCSFKKRQGKYPNPLRHLEYLRKNNKKSGDEATSSTAAKKNDGAQPQNSASPANTPTHNDTSKHGNYTNDIDGRADNQTESGDWFSLRVGAKGLHSVLALFKWRLNFSLSRDNGGGDRKQ